MLDVGRPSVPWTCGSSSSAFFQKYTFFSYSQCFIHGEDCTVDGSGGDDCCGEEKYLCEVVLDSAGTKTKCCIPLWNKGCGQDSHCCGSADSENIKCIESTCIDSQSDPPDDAKGTRSVSRIHRQKDERIDRFQTMADRNRVNVAVFTEGRKLFDKG
jgi:hypothetical protein